MASSDTAMQSRRTFLTKTATLATAIGLTGAPVRALSRRELAQPGNAFLPDPQFESNFRTLAQHAVDAAKAAGATYADARLEERQFLRTSLTYQGVDPSITVSATLRYSVRVLVDGAWGTAFGDIITADSLTRAARSAVTHAKREAAIIAREGSRRAEWAQAPAIRGEWSSPVEVDPFTVPLRDQARMMSASIIAASRVLGFDQCVFRNMWTRRTAVFASTEGALLIQRFAEAEPSIRVTVAVNGRTVSEPVEMLQPGLAGYESVTQRDLVEKTKEAGDRARQWASYPRADLDVGRYAMVTEGRATAELVSKTICAALEMDRLLGFEADTVGGSYLQPIGATIANGIPSFSTAVTLKSTPTLSSSTSVKWDDDGVSPESYTVVDRGRVVDAFTSRDTAHGLAEHYRRIGTPVRSRGCSIAGWNEQPVCVAPEATLQAGAQTRDVADLIAEMGNGLFVRDFTLQPAPGLGTVDARNGNIYVVKNGKIVGQAPLSLLLFRTQRLWKDSLLALGDNTTSKLTKTHARKGMPWKGYMQCVTAPAALFKEVDVHIPQANMTW